MPCCIIAEFIHTYISLRYNKQTRTMQGQNSHKFLDSHPTKDGITALFHGSNISNPSLNHRVGSLLTMPVSTSPRSPSTNLSWVLFSAMLKNLSSMSSRTSSSSRCEGSLRILDSNSYSASRILSTTWRARECLDMACREPSV